jgi:serine/threonine protein kinase
LATYTNITRLGTGAFGDVWSVKREADGRIFAKKTLKTTATKGEVKRFTKEVRLLSKMDHPNVVKVHSSRLTSPPFYFMMPLYEHSLEAILNDVIGNEARIVPIFTAILDAMEYSHGEGILHRDLKPGNVLMNSDHDLVVSDFGLGRDTKSGSERETETGMRGGTRCYWPPEQQVDFKKATVQSDIYTLGRMLYELFTEPLQSDLQDLGQLPGHISFIVKKCTQMKPKDRFVSVSDLKETWLQAIDEGGDVSPEDEVNELVAELVAATEVPEDTVQKLLHLLENGIADSDLIHNAIMRLPVNVLKMMYDLDDSATQRLIAQFVNHATSQEWGFSYTDKIGNQCVRLYKAIKDYQIRADLTYCVVQVGVRHSRWQLLKQGEELLVASKLPGESLALVARLKNAEQFVIKWINENCPLRKLSKTIRDFVAGRKGKL